MKKDFTSAVLSVLVLTLVLGVAYPLLTTGVSQLAFPGNANGQKVYLGGKLVGSKIIGQDFGQKPQYFQTRPSGEATADDAAATAFGNYGPNSTVTLAELRKNIAAYMKLNGPYYPGGLTAAQVPVDAANTSASGIDPDISQANAWIQAYRVAKVRGLPLARVDRLISKHTAGRGLGFSGEPGVDVLELNLALNRLGGAS